MDPLRLHDYLVAARTRLFDWIRPLDGQQYAAEHPIGLGSLARTLHHVKAAEWMYMERIRGRTGPIDAPGVENDPEVSAADAMPFDALEAAWRAQSEQVHADLASVSEWDARRVYTTMWEGRPYAYRASASDIFSQLALHEVHHRAQVLHMLRRTGVATDEIDFNALMWEPVNASD
ncbi:MAG: DinB family protein [Planctomycetota bacterium]